MRCDTCAGTGVSDTKVKPSPCSVPYSVHLSVLVLPASPWSLYRKGFWNGIQMGWGCFVYRCCKGRPISAVNRKESWNWCKATDDWCQVQLVWYRKVDPCLCCNCIPSIVLSQSVQFGEELHHMCSRLRFPNPLATGHEWHERDDMNDMNVHDSWGPDYRLPCYALCTLKWKLIWMCLSQWIKDED